MLILKKTAVVAVFLSFSCYQTFFAVKSRVSAFILVSSPLEKAMSHMSRTYLPTLVRILHKVCVYIARYRDQIVDNLPNGSEPVVDAVVVACNALIDIISIPVEP